MNEISVEHFSDFENKVFELQNLRDKKISKTKLKISDFLFRGQSNSEWHLETSLDRLYKREVDILDYYRKVLVTVPVISSITEKKWNIGGKKDIKKWFDNIDPTIIKLHSYDYLIYLRHHGFPSPLLDWTSSPYVAAYFAFEHIEKNVESVSIYIYMEHSGRGKETSTDSPNIYCPGPYVETHRRHFLQKSQYTYCIRLDDNNSYKFTSHENATKPININKQDIFYKVTMPSSERSAVLKRLESMNINAFSLFGSEDSLIKSLAIREFVIKEKFK